MECLSPALTRRIDGIDAFAGIHQIGSVATTGQAATFSDIPARFAHLLVEVLGISHDGASNQQLRLELSPNGAAWTGPSAIASAVNNSGLLYGSFWVPGYSKGAGSIAPSFGNLSTDLSTGNSGGLALSWRVAGGIAAMRFSWSGGANFDATGPGLIRLHGF